MAGAEIDAVLAGTREFQLALFSPVAERVGAPPQLATDPAHALVFARGPGSVVVVEFLGADSLAAIKDLVLDGEGVRIVAAVPAAHGAAHAPLGALGVEAVRWDGTPDAVVGALERQLASAAAHPASPAAAPRAPAAAARTPSPGARAAPGGPALTPTKPIGAVAPAKRSAPAVARRAPAPPGAVAGPALTPARPGGAPSRGAGAAPALTPSRPVPAVARPAAPSRPAVPAPAPPAASEVQPPPPPRAAPPEDALAEGAPVPPASEGGLDERFFDGFEDDVAAAAEALGAADAPRAPTAGPPQDLFDDLREDAHAFDVDVDGGAPRLAAPPASAGAPWPTAVPGAVEAADALGRGLLGDLPAPGTALSAVADVIASLSELERAVFSGAPQPIDTEPVRRAAVMRVRVAAALATAPGAGGAVDSGAVSGFLAEIDALLSDVNALAAGAPAGVQASLEAMRNALVKEAIDFSEAVQQAAPAEALAPAEPVARPPRAGPTRVVSVSAPAAAEPPPRRQRAMLVVLAAAALAAGAFHGYRLHDARARIRSAPTIPGAPLGAIAPQADGPDVPGLPKMLHAPGAEAFDPGEVKAFSAQEQRKGNAVQEIAPGVIVVVPGQPPTEAR